MPTGSTSRRGPRAIAVDLPKRGVVTMYAGARVADALQDVTADMTLYEGVKLAQVLEAVYDQGLRHGRRDVFDELDKLKQRPELRHRNPGRPVKKTSAKKKAPARRKVAKKTVARKVKGRSGSPRNRQR